MATLEDSLLMCGAVLGDKAYFGDAYYGRIWSWDGSEFSLHRQLGTPDNPYSAQILGMVAFDGGLWLSILDTDGTVALLRDDKGSSDWCRPVTGLSGTTPGPLGIYAGNLYLASNATGASKLFNTNGTFRSTATVDSGLMDANLPGEQKLWHQVTVQHTALLSGESVAVSYALEDHGSWTLLGTSDTDGATSATFSFPNGTLANLVAIRLVLTAAAGASTQLKVYEVTTSYNPSKGALREWQVSALLYGHDGADGAASYRRRLADGSFETLTGEELSDAIWALIEAEQPVLFYDLDRSAPRMVRITGYRETLGGMPNLSAMQAGVDMIGELTLQEVAA